MFIIIWRYKVNPDCLAQFLSYYNSGGEWVKLFNRSSGYLGTDFFEEKKTQEFLTIDKWTDEESFKKFKETFKEQYEVFDKTCENFTLREDFLGSYTTHSN